MGHPHDKTTASKTAQGPGLGSEQGPEPGLGQDASSVIDKVVSVDNGDGGDIQESVQGPGAGPGLGLGPEVMDVVDAPLLPPHGDEENDHRSMAMKAQQMELEHFNKTNNNNNNNNNHNNNAVEGGGGVVGVETSGGVGGENTSGDVKEGMSGGVTEGVSVAGGAVAVNRTSMLRRGPRLLLELTRDQRMQWLVEHWRRADAFTWLLKEIARMGDEGGAPYVVHCSLESNMSSPTDPHHNDNQSEVVMMSDTTTTTTNNNDGAHNVSTDIIMTNVDHNATSATATATATGELKVDHPSLLGAVAGVDGNRARAHRSFLIRRQVTQPLPPLVLSRYIHPLILSSFIEHNITQS